MARTGGFSGSCSQAFDTGGAECTIKTDCPWKIGYTDSRTISDGGLAPRVPTPCSGFQTDRGMRAGAVEGWVCFPGSSSRQRLLALGILCEISAARLRLTR